MLMMFFKHSRFLRRSMLSFGVSTMSPKNSLSFNMSPKSAIIFIKCWSCHHMKNSIRYKGKINNTSVIIFLIGGQKLPAMLLCLEEPPVRVLWYWLSLFIHFCSSFGCFSLFILFFIFVDVLHSHLLFDIIHHPSMDYCQAFTPISYFQPSPSQSDHSVIFLPWPLRFWVGIFYPQTFFTLRSFTDILPELIKAFLGVGSSSLKFTGLHTDPWNTDLAHLFVWFTVIHSLHIQNDSFLNSTKY